MAGVENLTIGGEDVTKQFQVLNQDGSLNLSGSSDERSLVFPGLRGNDNLFSDRNVEQDPVSDESRQTKLALKEVGVDTWK